MSNNTIFFKAGMSRSVILDGTIVIYKNIDFRW